MKKFLGILAVAGALTACNNSGDGTSNADSLAHDSATIINNNVNVGADSLHATGDSSSRSSADSTHAVDSLKK